MIPDPDNAKDEPFRRRGLTLSEYRLDVAASLIDAEFKSMSMSALSSTTSSPRNSLTELIRSPFVDEKIAYPRDPYSRSSLSTAASSILPDITSLVIDHPFNSTTWQVALAGVFGSLIWIASSLFSFLPQAIPSSRFPGETEYGVGIMASLGSTLFFASSLIKIRHTLNENRSRYWGWAIQQAKNEYRAMRNIKNHNRRVEDWGWMPTYQDVREHFINDYGFRACVVTVFSSTLFFWTGICAVPAIYNQIASSRTMLDGLYWVPKLVACVGFVYSGVCDASDAWVRSRSNGWSVWRTISWHSALWSTVGGLGFLLMACFGFGREKWMQYQCSLAALWGSCAFLVASLLVLWDESRSVKAATITAAQEDVV